MLDKTVNLDKHGHRTIFAGTILDPATGGPIEPLGQTTAPPFSWTINLSSGTSVVLNVLDAAGNTGNSAAFTILAAAVGVICPQSGGQGSGQSGTDGNPPNGGGGGTGGSTNTTTNAGGGTGPTSGGSGGQNSSQGQGQGQTETSLTFTSTTSTTTTTTSTTAATDTFDQLTVSANSASSSVDNSQSSLSVPNLSDITPGASPPAIAILPSSSGVSSNSSGSSQDNSNSNNSKKSVVMSGPLIGGIVAGGLLFLLAMFLVVYRCRRRRRRASETILYPFDATDHSSDTTREMRGRAGYPPSTFSSWGNHGELGEDQRILSPTGTSEGHQAFNNGTTYNNTSPASPLEGASVESAYAYDGVQQTVNIDSRLPPSPTAVAPVSPYISRQAHPHGHAHGTSSSIDLDAGRRVPSEPGSPAHPGQRFRGPIPKSMIDAYRAGLVGPGPAAPLMSSSYAASIPIPLDDSEAQSHSHSHATPSTIGIGRVPSYRTLATMGSEIPPVPMLPPGMRRLPHPQPQSQGHGQPVVNYPPPYTSS
ncbi:hypothetical protein C8F01DRAFT_699500 [Mycena amicta]|nr:hypothetical protein C8F01DRAFT_699500 [Mycena amicta]